MRILNNNKHIPGYRDGSFTIYKIYHDPSTDFSVREIRPTKLKASYKELQLFDNTAIKFKAAGIEVTRKIRTRPIVIDVNSFVKIDNEFYKIENAVTALNSSGFPETDITLSRFTESYLINEGEYYD